MNYFRWSLFVTVVGGWLIGSSAAWGDIAPRPLSGGVTLSRWKKNEGKTRVAMVEEEVKLHVSRQSCATTAVFLMKNTGDQDETMEVGFPVFHSADFTTFTVIVDGEKVTPRDATVTDRSGDFERRRRWKVWQMTFAAGRTQRVEVNYQHSLSERSDSLEGTFLNAAERFRLVSVNYILVTGRDWHGNIGKCRIEMTFDGWSQENALSWGRYSEQCKVAADRVIWEIRDFEPKDDLGISLMPNATRKDLREALEQAIQKRDERELSLQCFLSNLDRTDGRERDGLRRDCDFVRAWQNRVAFWGPDTKDNKRLTDSFLIWTATEQLMKDCDRLGEQKTAKEIAPVIRKMARRLRTQAEAEPAESPSVKYRLPQIDEVLKWCDKYGA